MKFLSKPIARFPLGIWIVLVFLVISGLVMLLFAQALSFFAWDAAYSLGVQEDSRHSTDIVDRTIGAMSWGGGCGFSCTRDFDYFDPDWYSATASVWFCNRSDTGNYLDLRHAYDSASAYWPLQLGRGA